MMETCEAVRDRLPDVLAGRLAGPEAQAVLDHVAACGDCAGEAVVVQALRRLPDTVPGGLEQRIRQAVRRPTLRHDLRRPALIAAAVGAVVLGGSLLLRGHGHVPEGAGPAAGQGVVSSEPTSGSPKAPLAATDTRALSVAPDGRALMQPLPGTPDAGLYSSTATLEDLSEEELNTLLKELQS